MNIKIFTLNIKPLSINQAYRYSNNRCYLTKEAKEYKSKIQEIIKDENKIKGKVKLYVQFGFKDKRKRDVDNYLKIFIDSIKNILIEDDSEIISIIASKINSNKENIKFFIKKN